ncbi:MAG: TniQ family protein [Chloroflexota bacterium]
MKTCHLLLRSPLLPGESLPSYLVRLAKLNGYHTPNLVIQLCQERLSQPDIITRPTRAETYAQLTELTKLDDDRLYAASAHILAITILPAGTEPELIALRSGVGVALLPSAVLRQHLWPETDAQFCPHCLAEASYHRLAWLPQAVSACLAHRCLLVKGCPICGEKLKTGDVVEGRCGRCDFVTR